MTGIKFGEKPQKRCKFITVSTGLCMRNSFGDFCELHIGKKSKKKIARKHFRGSSKWNKEHGGFKAALE